MSEAKRQPKTDLQIFDSFEEVEAAERAEWMSLSGKEKMILLENLRKQSYPNEPGTPQGLQRVLAIID